MGFSIVQIYTDSFPFKPRLQLHLNSPAFQVATESRNLTTVTLLRVCLITIHNSDNCC